MPQISELAVGDSIGSTQITVDRATFVRYAGASGDFNPIHWDEKFATSVGLPSVIGHGMWTMGAAVSLVGEWVGDPGRVVEYGVRFSAPVVVEYGSANPLAVTGTIKKIDEIEAQVFESDPSVSRRIYELSQEVMELQRAVKPLQRILDALDKGVEKYGTDPELQRSLRDVADHATSVAERVDGFRQSLADILTLNATLVAQTQNEEMKRLAEVANNQADEVKKASSWAAILFTPTVVAGIYGMNFEKMPELSWWFGYPFALFLMFAVSTTMWVIFRRKNWL